MTDEEIRGLTNQELRDALEEVAATMRGTEIRQPSAMSVDDRVELARKLSDEARRRGLR